MVGVNRGNRRHILGSARGDAGFEFAAHIFLAIHCGKFAGPHRLRRVGHRGSEPVRTSSLMPGVGYQLEPVSERGPQVSALRQLGKTTNNELTAFLGETIVNSYHSERDSARALEYRHGLGRYVDVTLGVLNEGDIRLVRRTGITAQIWGVREVLASDRLVLGIGYGPYLAVDRYRAPLSGEGGSSAFSWIFTATAAFRLSQHWNARVSWNRINTNYNRAKSKLPIGSKQHPWTIS